MKMKKVETTKRINEQIMKEKEEIKGQFDQIKEQHQMDKQKEQQKENNKNQSRKENIRGTT